MDGQKLLNKIKKDRERIAEALDNHLDEWSQKGDSSEPWRTDTKERLQEMAKGGKMVRGSLIIKTHRFYNGDNQQNCLKTAGVIELLHTGLLMHDDIIDKDDYRRNMKTFAKQYEEVASQEQISEQKHFGNGMAIIGGDTAFFIGQSLLAELDLNRETYRELLDYLSTEFSSVCIAEQFDIYSGYQNEELTEEEILNLYRKKTARYTFSLPMKVGGLLANVDEEELERLDELGEHIGTIFQLKDDELSLFGYKEDTGKPRGTDLEENKKTLHRLKLLEKLPEDKSEEMKERLRGELTTEDKEEITERMEELDVKENVRSQMEEIAAESREKIDQLDINKEGKQFFKQMVQFCLERKK